MKSPKPYADDRLARLLALLRPAPAAWIARAQQIPFTQSTLSEADLEELQRRLDTDPGFRADFDRDPVAAAEAAGLRGLAAHLRNELQELLALAERIAGDEAYRARLAEDPYTAL